MECDYSYGPGMKTFLGAYAKEYLQRLTGLFPCTFTSCYLSGSYDIFLNVCLSNLCPFTKCLSNIDSLPQWCLNAADGHFVSQLWFMQLLLLPKYFFVYQLHPLTSAQCWKLGLFSSCSWGITYPFPDVITCTTIELFIYGLNAFYPCTNWGDTMTSL